MLSSYHKRSSSWQERRGAPVTTGDKQIPIKAYSFYRYWLIQFDANCNIIKENYKCEVCHQDFFFFYECNEDYHDPDVLCDLFGSHKINGQSRAISLQHYEMLPARSPENKQTLCWFMFYKELFVWAWKCPVIISADSLVNQTISHFE